MPAIQQQLESIRGELVTHRVFREGWGIGQIKAAGQVISVTGKLIGVRVGDTVDLTGTWETHAQWGKQFKIKECVPVRPEGSDGAVKWLASRFPSVGPVRATALVERFGEELWDVIEHHQDRMLEVDGFNQKIVDAIHETYLAHKDEREHMITLRGWGLTDSQIARCLDQFATLPRVVEELKKDPYMLSREVYGFGFLRSDAIAGKMGIAGDAPTRIRAGVEHVLTEACGNGHVFMAGAQLQNMASQLLSVGPQLVPDAIKELVTEKRLVKRGWRYYLSALDDAEQQAADGLARLLNGGDK